MLESNVEYSVSSSNNDMVDVKLFIWEGKVKIRADESDLDGTFNVKVIYELAHWLFQNSTPHINITPIEGNAEFLL